MGGVLTVLRLHEIATALVAPGKGILAADESIATMSGRLEAVGVAPSCRAGEALNTKRVRAIASALDGTWWIRCGDVAAELPTFCEKAG
jgi:hypothetical protein